MALKTGNSKIIVGYDLGKNNCRISYCSAQSNGVETAPSIAGTQIYNIPTVLCKKYEANQWLYGNEALRTAEAQEGILIDDLLRMALDGEPVMIEGEAYQPVALLSLFLKKSLGLLSAVGPIERIGAFLITCDRMNAETMEILKSALEGAELKAKYLYFQNYEESFYQYMIHQPEELSAYQTLLFDREGTQLKVLRMRTNAKTSPKTVLVTEEVYEDVFEKTFPEAGGELDGSCDAQLDQRMLKLTEQICGNDRISSVYLVGDGFDRDNLTGTLQYLCRGRRVFLGSNLYSQGACLGMMERLRPSAAGKRFAMLSSSKLKANIGMKVRRQGQETYYALLDAGCNWYEAQADCECYLQNENTFELVITPLNDKQGKIAQMTLEGLAAGIARIYVHLKMTAEDILTITVEDLGFGEFRSPQGQVWTEEVRLYE